MNYLRDNYLRGLATPPTREWQSTLLITTIYVLLALGANGLFGLFHPLYNPGDNPIRLALMLVVFPTFLEESLFRGILIPIDTYQKGGRTTPHTEPDERKLGGSIRFLKLRFRPQAIRRRLCDAWIRARVPDVFQMSDTESRCAGDEGRSPFSPPLPVGHAMLDFTRDVINRTELAGIDFQISL